MITDIVKTNKLGIYTNRSIDKRNLYLRVESHNVTDLLLFYLLFCYEVQLRHDFFKTIQTYFNPVIF